MDQEIYNLPFKIGEEAEAKSFISGYRGAWFRCKIKDISMKNGHIGYSLEYFDFPDEKVTWTKLYQKPPGCPKLRDSRKLELMVRPAFPPFFRETERPDSYPASDVVAIVEDEWAVGDLVDWWYNDCFWSCRVTQLLGNNKVQVKLPGPPIGEGNSYAAFCKDLRPSLHWSPEHGWTVPISREYGGSQYCARLVQPIRQDEEAEGDTRLETSTEQNEVPGTAEDTPICEASPAHDEVEPFPIVSPKVSSSGVSRYSSPNFQKIVSRETKYFAPAKRPDTLEAAFMELEELANKIRWLRGLLQFGFHWSNAMKPSWKILENYGSNVRR